jgi:hypothetical protein
MDLTKFKFPELTFAPKTNSDLLKAAKDKGFYNGRTAYNKLFSDLFFSGGSVTFKNDIDEKFRNECWSYCRSFMRSFEPKHEEKEAICAYLMSNILQIPE